MKLHNGRPYWEENKIKLNKVEDSSTEILIIGAGYTGLIIAYFYHTLGFKVMVVDKRGIATGSTRAATALLQWCSDKSLLKMVNDSDIDGVQYYSKSLKAIELIENIIAEIGGDIPFKRIVSKYKASSDDELATLSKEYTLLKQNGFNVEFYQDEILFYDDAMIDPVKFCRQLYDFLCSNDVLFFEGNYYSHKENSAHINQKEVKYENIIIACGYETLELKNLSEACLYQSYVIVTNKVNHTIDYMWWETNRPYYYIRPTFDNRIIIGGCDVLVKQEKHVNENVVYEKLLEKAKAVYGIADLHIEYQYHAPFGSTLSGVPVVKNINNASYVYSYGGNGIIGILCIINQLPHLSGIII